MMSTPLTQHFEGSAGLRITADVHGDPARQAVVFLHGGGQTRHAWGDSARRLAAEGYYALTLDLRGHGDSGWAPNGEYDIDDFVADLRAVVQQLPNAGTDAEMPVLVGASLGGVTSLVAVGTSEEPIASGLVLVDIVPKINPEGVARISGFMRANPRGFTSVEQAADVVAAYLPHRPKPKDISGLQKNLRLHADGRYYWHWDPSFIFREHDISPLQSRSRLDDAARGVRIPTLLVKGGISEIVDDAGVEEFREVMPEAEIVNVRGAGHMVAGDNNNAFHDAVLEFLKRI